MQESWLSTESDTSLLKHEGYNLISVGKTCSAHGGLAIYLNDEMNYKILNLYEQSNIWEGQFIEVGKLYSSKKTYNRKHLQATKQYD